LCSGEREAAARKGEAPETKGKEADAGSPAEAAEAERPTAKFGRYVEEPLPLGEIPALPCKRPSAWDAEGEEKYGQWTTLGQEIKNGIILAWTHACQPSTRELRFFQKLHVEGRARVFGLQHRENPRSAQGGQAVWEDHWGATYLDIVEQKGATFPQFAVFEKGVNAIENGAGVPRGKETYPFAAVVSGGNVVYYAAGPLWDERLDWEGKQAKGKRNKAIQDKREGFKERKEEFLSVAEHYLAPRK
jgi:hypothetical protein